MKSLTFPFPLVIAFPALMVTSCLDSDTAYTLNPDGSGKVVHQLKFKKQAGNWTDEDPAKALAMGFVRGAQGVEAWDDVHYRMTDGGQAVEFRGTAYFRDINKVALGSFIQEGQIQQLPVPMLEMKKQDGKQVVILKDPPAWKTKTKMEITVGGVPVPPKEEDDEEGEDGKPGALDSLMAASFALGGSIKTTIHIDEEITEANGFTIDKTGRTATFHYQPNFDGKSGKGEFAERFQEVHGEALEKEGFDELFAAGIVENEKLQEVVSGAKPPMTATLDIKGASFAYDIEAAAADIKVTEDQSAGWKKLESIDP